MELIKDSNIDFIGRRKNGFVFSAMIILAGVISLILNGGPNFGIDFSGGVKIVAKFESKISESEIESKLTELGYSDADIKIDHAKNEAMISVAKRDEILEGEASLGQSIANALIADGNSWKVIDGGLNISEVGPSVGEDLKWSALLSIFSSILILLAYISFRFQFRFAVGAIAALIHDVLITLGIFSIFSKEINLPTVAAFLTIIGYSLNDTIVVFDRIRENRNLHRNWEYKETLNRSINQSLSRTIITSLTTLAVVLIIFFMSSAGEEINTFALALIVGVLIGTYSSIFIASPILYIWHLVAEEKSPELEMKSEELKV